MGSKLLIGFEVKGSYFDLFIAYTLGITCLLSMGLIVASRTSSKEFADGMLNLFSWPMMFMSGVFFSLEGSSEAVKWVANLLPLNHLVESTRRIIIEGATLSDLTYNIFFMLFVSLVFLTLSSVIFRWSDE